MANTIALIEYFKAHARRVYELLSCPPTEKRIPAIVEMAMDNGGAVSARDVYRRGFPEFKSTRDVHPIFHDMEQDGLGRIFMGARGGVSFILDQPS